MRTAEVHIMNGSARSIFHGYQVDHGEWHFTSVKYSGMMIAPDTLHLMTYMANEIAGMTDYAVSSIIMGEPRKVTDVYPDRMHCAIVGGRYLGFPAWLTEMLPASITAAGKS